MTPYFFGYGSLVNRATHNYPDAQAADLQGWRRAWVRSSKFDRVFLSVFPDPTTTISGLIAAVPNADWSALDEREAGYDRILSGSAVKHKLDPPPEIAHYSVPATDHGPVTKDRIVLSYIDVVVQGFLREFGEEGVKAFFDTTDNWDTPILDDRDAPEYPRHQILTDAETRLVDYHLNRLSAQIEQGH